MHMQLFVLRCIPCCATGMFSDGLCELLRQGGVVAGVGWCLALLHQLLQRHVAYFHPLLSGSILLV